MTYCFSGSGRDLRAFGTLALVALFLGCGLSGCGGESGDRSGDAGKTDDQAAQAAADTLAQLPADAPAEQAADAAATTERIIGGEGLPELSMPSAEVLQQLRTKLQSGYMALRKGEAATAVDYFRTALELVPDGAMLHYHLALGLAAHENYPEALASLKAAAARGFCDVATVKNDASLAEVRKLDGWPSLIQQMAEKQSLSRGVQRVSYRRLDPDQEPAFTSLQGLIQHYGQEASSTTTLLIIYPNDAVFPLIWNLLNRKMAALERYGEGDTEDTERLRIEDEILKTVASYESPQRTPWLPSTVEIIETKTEEFIRNHPDQKSACAHAAYLQARAKWCAIRPSEDDSVTDENLVTAVELLAGIHEQYPGTLAALLALVDVLDVIGQPKGIGAEQLQPLVAIIQSEYSTHAAMRQLNYRIQPYVLAAQGLPEFTVTDLDGKVWNTADLGGKITLIDFWATWCKPCLNEIPNLVELHSKYHGQGFQILGISLDEPNKTTEEDLRKWARENGMTWPIAYDGKAWASPLVQKCGVTGIPFPILVDRDGKIAAAAQGATAYNLRAALERLFDKS